MYSYILLKTQEGSCESPLNYVGRNNAGGQDLNRDFPDRFETNRIQRQSHKQPETAAMMDWILANPFVLSANLHGGAVVASYPFDNSMLVYMSRNSNARSIVLACREHTASIVSTSARTV